jgi:phosphatidylcholine synthase
MSGHRSIALLVHLFTLSGVVLALLALEAVVRGDLPKAFAWLGLAFVVDGADGPLARHFRIREYLPRWQGEVFDLIIDYVTYVFIPAFMLLWGSVVPEGWELPAAGLICVTSAFHFADMRHKTTDWYFFGFPAIWNVVVFYLVVFALPPIASMVLIGFFAVMTFVPAAYIHRVDRLDDLRPCRRFAGARSGAVDQDRPCADAGLFRGDQYLAEPPADDELMRHPSKAGEVVAGCGGQPGALPCRSARKGLARIVPARQYRSAFGAVRG